MPRSYTQEELDKAYERLPDELQKAVFSIETSDAVWRACERQGIKDERFGEIGRRVGYVLMGLILPAEFQGILEKEVKLPKAAAKEIARDINRFVFYPVRPALEQLHRMEIEVSAKIVTPEPSSEEAQQPKKEEPRREDAYREPVE